MELSKEEKKDLIDKFCINSYRLQSEDDKDELLGINFLLGDISYVDINTIKDYILCMNLNHINYESLLESRKQLIKKLIKNEEIVNIVLFTVFQWFGTSVGKYEIGKLLDKIRKNDK